MKSILILGLGLIGGSLAKAIKESELEYRIYAYDPDQLSLENALNDKSIDEAIDQIETILQIEDLSLIMLCSSICLLYTSPSPRDDCPSRMPSSA